MEHAVEFAFANELWVLLPHALHLDSHLLVVLVGFSLDPGALVDLSESSLINLIPNPER